MTSLTTDKRAAPVTMHQSIKVKIEVEQIEKLLKARTLNTFGFVLTYIYIGALLHIKISIYYIRKIDKAVPRVTGLDVRGGTEVQIER